MYPNNRVVKTILLIIHRVYKEWLALKFWDKVILVKCQFDLSHSLRQTRFWEHPTETTQELKFLWWMKEQDIIGVLINAFWLGNLPRFITIKCPCLNKITKLWYKNNDKCLVIGCYTSAGTRNTSKILVSRTVFKMLSDKQATEKDGWPLCIYFTWPWVRIGSESSSHWGRCTWGTELWGIWLTRSASFHMV